MRDKRLLAFPVISGFACALTIIGFFLPMRYASTGIFFATLAIGYFTLCFVMIFFNAAMIACAVELMRRREATLTFGIKTAFQRLPQIAGWAIISGTVGIALRSIEDRSSWIRSMLADFLGAAWALVSYLVIPVIVAEGIGPIAALRESADLLGKTWGQRVVGGFGIESLYGLCCIPGGVLIFAAFKYGGPLPHPGLLGWGCLIVAIAYLLILSVLHSSLRSVFQAAIFLHVHDGDDALRGFPAAVIEQGIQAPSITIRL